MNKHISTFENFLNESTDLPLATATKSIPVIKDKILTEIGVKDWDSDEAKLKRKEIATSLGDTIEGVSDAVNSTLTNRKKGKRLRAILNGSAYISLVLGVWQYFTKMSLQWPELRFWEKGGIDLDIIDSPTFWLQIAILLFLLRIIHKVVSTGTLLGADVKNIWTKIKNFFSSKKKESTNESLNEEFNDVIEFIDGQINSIQ